MSDETIKRQLQELSTELAGHEKRLHEQAMRLVEGTHARIVSDWNGQPYGSSRPSRRGQVLAIEHIGLMHPIGVYVKDFPYDSPPLLADVEFITEQA